MKLLLLIEIVSYALLCHSKRHKEQRLPESENQLTIATLQNGFRKMKKKEDKKKKSRRSRRERSSRKKHKCKIAKKSVQDKRKLSTNETYLHAIILETNQTYSHANIPRTNENFSNPITPWCAEAGDRILPITLGEYNTCVGGYGVRLECWGLNKEGQVGDGTIEKVRLYPTRIPLGNVFSPLSQIVLGYNHACIIDNNNNLKCWGTNQFGQLGDGTNTNRNTPTTISLGSDLSFATKIMLGYGHTCSIDSLDNLKCWGWNHKGQLGDGTNTQQTTPTTISLGMGSVYATEVAIGYDYTCIIDSLHRVNCWGGNEYGQLGDGTTSSRLTPTLIPLGLDIDNPSATKISAGDYHTCAVDTLDNLKCWGRNHKGQLGDGTDTQRNKPIIISLGMGNPSPNKIALGGSHTCAIDNSDKLKCWGWNRFGQLGDGTNTDHAIQTLISIGSDNTFVTSIALGRYHTCAMDNLENLMCWGYGNQGQIGDGQSVWSLTPKIILEFHEDQSETFT